MKTLVYSFATVAIAIWFAGIASAQHYVPVEPLNKNVIYEEFTGVKCPNCPAGHVVMSQIIAANPGRAFVVAYHPFNSSYTLPYAGDPDFRRHYADSLYMTPWCGTSRYMPSAFVHRRLWSPPERLAERNYWAGYGATIMNEPSPLNVGMATKYDPATQILSVVVDVYYTENVSGGHNLMVTLAENDLQSQQSGATGTYTHKHTFREAFTGQWGDPLSENAQSGTFFTKEFTFDNSISNYLMENCELMAFVLDNASDEVVSGIGCNVGDTTYITPDISLSADTLFFTTATQCMDGLTATVKNNTSVQLKLQDVQPASLLTSQLNWLVDPWPFTTFPHILNPDDSVNLTIHVDLPADNPASGFLLDSLYIVSELDTYYLMIAVDQDLYTSLAEPGIHPQQVVLYSNHPNPSVSGTTIKYYIPSDSDIRLEVLDLNGKPVRILQSGKQSAGLHSVKWDGKDAMMRMVPSGVLLYRLTTTNGMFTRRLVVIR